jgi:hypothetical protein
VIDGVSVKALAVVNEVVVVVAAVASVVVGAGAPSIGLDSVVDGVVSAEASVVVDVKRPGGETGCRRRAPPT